MSAADATRAAGGAAASRSLLTRWVELWDEREPPTLLAAIRIGLALVVLVDLIEVGVQRIPIWLWAAPSAGGISGWDPAEAPPFYRIFPESAGSALGLWLALLGCLLCVGAGFFTRSAALAYVWLSAQAALIDNPADRAIDRVVRIVLLILAFSAAGRAWSVEARLRTGRWRGDGALELAWPRYLIVGQLVLVYCGAGLGKGGTDWYPWGGYRALYLTLQDPIFAAADFSWLARPLPYRLTQLATAVTHLWELSAPLLLVAAHWRRSEPGRLRRWLGRLPLMSRLLRPSSLRNAYVAIGIGFHLSLACTLRLGIFPFAMLACFPAFFRPEELASALAVLRRQR